MMTFSNILTLCLEPFYLRLRDAYRQRRLRRAYAELAFMKDASKAWGIAISEQAKLIVNLEQEMRNGK